MFLVFCLVSAILNIRDLKLNNERRPIYLKG